MTKKKEEEFVSAGSIIRKGIPLYSGNVYRILDSESSEIVAMYTDSEKFVNEHGGEISGDVAIVLECLGNECAFYVRKGGQE